MYYKHFYYYLTFILILKHTHKLRRRAFNNLNLRYATYSQVKVYLHSHNCNNHRVYH